MTFDWLPTAIAAVMFVGAAAVYLRGSKDKGTIATLAANNEALTERVGILEEANKDLKTSKDTLTVRVETLERENETLRSVDSAKEEIASLHSALDSHHAAAMGGMGQIHDDLEGIAAGIAAVISKGGNR